MTVNAPYRRETREVREDQGVFVLSPPNTEITIHMNVHFIRLLLNILDDFEEIEPEMFTFRKMLRRRLNLPATTEEIEADQRAADRAFRRDNYRRQ